MSGPLTVYTYANCDTCRRAVKWLRAQKIDFTEKPIRETPPTKAELHTMLARLGGAGSLRKLFNTSGVDYRAQKLGEKLPAMTEADAIALLAGNGNLVKRPFALGAGTGASGVGLVGFDEATWSAALS
ncbi:Spx/MgsR family RNA polymerase-binding regulatory protein [Rariglobus hedericola]|uniref:Spx/MgsR family RNA polymerase-binding regulatory protein n=1 Tax=Rariglobus hedericola TaxID=2597822 RepID=A0A556QJU3_9BACT|nr:Spx/MgsR family RNA polymerase-binding regulatory protein [Rariglobus hedericola]TSJ76887.1 Spx/MgsR family RNA polymerase-binding regulatory protein [Rariglobus hedericola]